jgi:hypothetical protein
VNERAAVLKRHHAGQTVRQLSAWFELSETRIKQLLWEAGEEV